LGFPKEGSHFRAVLPALYTSAWPDACIYQPDSYDAPQLESFAFPLQSH